MDKEIFFKAKIREKKNDKKNDNNSIPAVIYGQDTENQNLLINKNDFDNVYNVAGESNLINLEINGKETIKVVIKDTQKNPISGNFIHVDFYKVNMNKPIVAEIPFDFIGESRAVKELGGVLMRNMDSIEVECLPGDLVNNIKIDLSNLKEINDAIRINDLNLSDKFKVTEAEDQIIISVGEQKKEEEVKPEEIIKDVAGDETSEKKDEEKSSENSKGEDSKPEK